MDNIKTTNPFPSLSYYGNKLVVDQAWVDARRKTVLVEIEGRHFELDLDNALARPFPCRCLDQCDLMTTARHPSKADWPLGQGGHDPAFRFVLRSSVPTARPHPDPQLSGRTEDLMVRDELMLAQSESTAKWLN